MEQNTLVWSLTRLPSELIVSIDPLSLSSGAQNSHPQSKVYWLCIDEYSASSGQSVKSMTCLLYMLAACCQWKLPPWASVTVHKLIKPLHLLLKIHVLDIEKKKKNDLHFKFVQISITWIIFIWGLLFTDYTERFLSEHRRSKIAAPLCDYPALF